MAFALRKRLMSALIDGEAVAELPTAEVPLLLFPRPLLLLLLTMPAVEDTTGAVLKGRREVASGSAGGVLLSTRALATLPSLRRRPLSWERILLPLPNIGFA